MRASLFSVALTVFAQTWVGFASPIEARAVGSSLFNELERFAKFSSAAYQIFGCPSPLGTTLVKTVDKDHTQGFIARDDSRKEIIVAFRGTLSVADAFVDLQILFTPLTSPGTSNVGNAKVHTGFHYAYNVVANDILNTVKAQVAAKPGYSIVVTGHSLGGAVASIAALSIKTSLPNVSLKLYTYGQPRVGNAEFATLVENRVGVSNIFRSVHTYDGVPTFLLDDVGYRHFATEYWQFQEPANANNIKVCSGPEDQSCSESIPSTFINPAHVVYYGHAMALNPFLCFW